MMYNYKVVNKGIMYNNNNIIEHKYVHTCFVIGIFSTVLFQFLKS